MRLVPAYVLCIVLVSWLSPNDPLSSLEGCKKYWWHNALFINNVYNFGAWASEAGCLGQSWSVAVEFQVGCV